MIFQGISKQIRSIQLHPFHRAMHPFKPKANLENFYKVHWDG